MNSIKQILRQPMKTLSGVILVALAVSILCLCLGQSLAAVKMGDSIDDIFTTIALPTFVYNFEDGDSWAKATLPDDLSAWIAGLREHYPDIVKGADSPGLASAYIPQLTIDNYTQHPNVWNGTVSYNYSELGQVNYGTPYNCAMLEITLTDTGAQLDNDSNIIWQCTGIVESVVGLDQGYADPTGFTVKVKVFLPEVTAVEELDLEVGQRYLVYSMRYVDLDWQVRDSLSEGHETGEITLQYIHPNLIEHYNEEIIENNKESGWRYVVASYKDPDTEMTYYIHNNQIDNIHSVQVDIKDPSILPSYQDIEGIGNYGIPTIVKLDGTVEEFLASEDGTLWQEALDALEITNHAFAVFGVERLGQISDFNRGLSEITTGREFTAEELESGARVCIISEAVAAASGLTVGDAITVRYYEHDGSSVYMDTLAEGKGVIKPSAEYYTAHTPFTGDGEKYTIIGLYTQKDDWSSVKDNLYSFTSNTVFVPANSVQVEMQYTDQGVLGVIELYNGKIDDFYEILDEAGYRRAFECYDQGYALVSENLQNYGSLSQQAMMIGAAVYAVVLFIYLAMFPAQQGRTLRQMASMGAGIGEKLKYILLTGLGIVLPGTALGTVSAVILWDGAVAALTEAVAVELDLSLDLGMILGVSSIQLLLALFLALMVSIPLLCANPMKRK